jgi:HEAT repeat protein
MEDHETLLEKIQEILGGTPGNMKILEHQIDMDLQVEYFECSRKMNLEYEEEWAFDHMQYLSEPGYSNDVKKEILARLATIEDPSCFRAIQLYAKSAEEPLRDWALLALNESRMHLESKLMEENQVYISTGLGGRKEKLRYFVVLISRMRAELTPTHQMVIRNEFDYVLKKYDAELEDVKFSGYLATILLLLPMNHSLKEVFSEAIWECNQYGHFLKDDFIVTNVKTLSFKEIKDFLERKTEMD